MNVIEACLFVAGEPIALSGLSEALEVTELELLPLLTDMAARYEREGRGVQLQLFGDSVQMCSNALFAPVIQRLLQLETEHRLTQSTLETLSIVAYKQPITRAEIEAVRGVNCDYAVNILLSRGLIEQVGYKETLGRPRLFGTTELFLREFALTSLSGLPKLSPADEGISAALPRLVFEQSEEDSPED